MKKTINPIGINFKSMGLAGLLSVSLAYSGLGFTADTVTTLDITGTRDVAGCARSPITTLQQSYLLVDAPDASAAKGILLLFVGGGGKLDIADAQLKVSSANFLLRSRHLFAAQGFHVALMDAANDFIDCSGGLRNRRTSGKYTRDMAAVIADLRTRFPGLPLWAVGTSRGTTAAAQAAALVPGVDGLVLTSSMTNPITASVFDVPLDLITVPTIITSHEQDGCFVTPPSGVQSIKDALVSARKIKTREFDGGFPALSANPCDATTAHGYLGIESKVVRKITRWIMKMQVM